MLPDIYKNMFNGTRTKKFSQKVHDSVDPRSRQVVIDYLNKMGFPFYSNPWKYGIDLFSIFTPKIAIELEHRDIWVHEEFPYPSVHIPYRKAKFLGGDRVHYCVINKDFTRIGLCLGSKLKMFPKVYEIGNSAVGRGEWFYNIPKDAFQWIQI